MQFLLFLAASLGPMALAQRSTVNLVCSTSYSTLSVNSIGTQLLSDSTTETARQTVFTNPRVTTTLAAETITFTTTQAAATTTANAATTDTFILYRTTTVTSTSTRTATFTGTLTVSTTSTVLEQTTTIFNSPGFTPLRNAPGYQFKRDAMMDRAASQNEKRSFHLPELKHAAANNDSSDISRRQNAGDIFPVRVRCTSRTTFFRTATVTSPVVGATTSTITSAAAIVTRTVTTANAGTVTVTPASTTRTVTLTTTRSVATISTTTTNEITTVTAVLNLPGATQYNQCLPRNRVSRAFGNDIGGIDINAPGFTVSSVDTTDTDGTQCCVACATSDNCGGYAQNPDGTCFVVLTPQGVCTPSSTFGNTYRYFNVDGQASYIVGNGRCGQLGFAAGPAPEN